MLLVNTLHICAYVTFILHFLFSCMPYCTLNFHFIFLIIPITTMSLFSSLPSLPLRHSHLLFHLLFIITVFPFTSTLYCSSSSTVKITLFCNVMPHNLVDRFQCLRGNCWRHLQERSDGIVSQNRVITYRNDNINIRRYCGAFLP